MSRPATIATFVQLAASEARSPALSPACRGTVLDRSRRNFRGHNEKPAEELIFESKAGIGGCHRDMGSVEGRAHEVG